MSVYSSVCKNDLKVIGELNINSTLTTPNDKDLILTTGSINMTLRVLRNTDLTYHNIINVNNLTATLGTFTGTLQATNFEAVTGSTINVYDNLNLQGNNIVNINNLSVN